MKCPHCGSGSSRVIDTTRSAKGVRRRRTCKSCGKRFSTLEQVVLATPLIVKRDGQLEEFSREKLLVSLRTACSRRPVSADDLDRLVDRVENGVLRMGKMKIPSRTVGDLIISELKVLDPVSYIRYAIVYLGLEDLNAVRVEIDRLLGERE